MMQRKVWNHENAPITKKRHNFEYMFKNYEMYSRFMLNFKETSYLLPIIGSSFFSDF